MIAAFNEEFIQTGELSRDLFLKLRDGFEDRAEGDYGLVVISEEQARAGLAAAREFLDQINRRLRGRESGEI